MYKVASLSEIERKIIEERNKDVSDIEREVITISEIMLDLAVLVNDQKETIETVVQNIENSNVNIEESVKTLEKAEEYVIQNNKTIRNAIIIIGGISLGALGFIAGPIVGVATLLTGAVTGTSIAVVL